ncbi:CHAT domain-containing protein [Flavilitoribacter nigricans]|uniref:CHAT domain-containing protein n=1 Tax=Flavilitoribacter nigricans (strain ATCC 23147 / DSM 23189 / NBRC 102662 / NCIMB 1420 / SS-2) TaxID=1122177 RepID=A0A2D0N6B2_FLAN2|nr:tetratricopeptide repeat protein [Flavilitoribacter nigricans]PHN03997.1 hypothetical protein CRP01_24315 [Flavilitoribacter nigricans DSM 23189 = NBRC 102662]
MYFWLVVSTVGAQVTDPAVAREQLQRVEDLLDAAAYQRADSLLRSVSPEVLALERPELEAEVFRLSGYLALETGDYMRAYDVFRQVVTFTENNFPKKDPVIGQAYNDLGHYYFTTGQLDSARQFHEAALAIRMAHYGATDPKVADSNNNLGNVYQSAGRSTEALVYYEKALAIRRRHRASDPSALASALNNIGSAYLYLGQVNRATQAFRQTLDIRIDILGPDHPRYGRTLQNLGNAFYQAGALDSAQLYYEIALENARLNYDSTHPQLANLYENLGNCALRKNQLDLAEQQHRQALHIREALSDADPVAPATSYLHLGDINRQKGDYLEALQLTEKGWSILTEYLQEEDPYLADAWEKLGLCHQVLGHFLEARDALMTALDIRWKFFGPNHPVIAGAYTNLGNVYWQDSDHASALYYYGKALEIWRQYGGQHLREQAEAYSNIGNSYLKNKSWPEALEAYQQALALLSGESARLRAAVWQQIGVAYDGLQEYAAALDAYDKALELFDRNRTEQQMEILYTLSTRANTLLRVYESGRDPDTLRLAAAAFEESMQLLNERQLNILHTESRQKGVALHYDLFEGAIACQLARWQMEKDSAYLWRAFQLSENSKGLRLREKWLEKPEDNNANTSALARALSMKEAAAGSLQERLRGNRGLLALFAGPKKLFWFFLKDHQLQAGIIDGMPEIDRLTADLGQSLAQYPLAGSEQQVVLDSFYQLTARKLYQRVWLPMEQAFRGASRLIIVPDGTLAYLPFAVLLTGEPKVAMRYRSYPYLLRDYQIGYAYSTALLAKALQQPELEEKQTCLAIAPVFDGHRPALAPLDYNAEEVKGLAREVGATTLIGQEATRSKFLDLAGQYRILHLATHGIANIYRSEFSYLAFTLPDTTANGRLYVQDLYQMELPADMIVMSACESGIGRFQAGEGAISLGRGFAAAGARSLIATLWNVNDHKTSEFMQDFYREMKKGLSKDEAIRKVQQNYLKKAGQADAHPFYWAAYLPIGDMEPLDLGPRSYLWLLGPLFLLVLGLVWWLKPGLLKNLSK